MLKRVFTALRNRAKENKIKDFLERLKAITQNIPLANYHEAQELIQEFMESYKEVNKVIEEIDNKGLKEKYHRHIEETVNLFRDSLFNKIDNSRNVEECVFYVENLTNVVSLKLPIEEILLNKFYSFSNTKGSFKRNLENLISSNEKIFEKFQINKERFYQTLLNVKLEEYKEKFTNLFSELASSFEYDAFDPRAKIKYERLKSKFEEDLEGKEIPIEIYTGKGIFMKKIDPNFVFYDLSLKHILGYLLKLFRDVNNGGMHELGIYNVDVEVAEKLGIGPVEKIVLTPENIASEMFLDYYKHLRNMAAECIKKGKIRQMLSREDKLSLINAISSVKKEYNAIIESVRREIEKEQDELYVRVESFVENPNVKDRWEAEVKFEEMFREFYEFSMKYKTLLEESDEELKQLYENLKSKLLNKFGSIY